MLKFQCVTLLRLSVEVEELIRKFIIDSLAEKLVMMRQMLHLLSLSLRARMGLGLGARWITWKCGGGRWRRRFFFTVIVIGFITRVVVLLSIVIEILLLFLSLDSHNWALSSWSTGR